MLKQDQIKDLDALWPGQATANGASRRTALKVALGVGYAAAAMPVMAQTAIKTSSGGLSTGEAVYQVAGFSVPIFYAAPAGKKNLPVILVTQEIFGVHEYIADTCRRFAKVGYLAIAPELYARRGDPGENGGIPLTTIDQMKDALAAAAAKGNAAAKASAFVVYQDSPHAFHADYRPSYRKEPAEDGFKRALEWFQTHGVV